MWKTGVCDPSLVHVAITLYVEYLRGSIAAVHSILQHSLCPESVFFHFLVSETGLEAVVPSTFPGLKFKIYYFDPERVRSLISSFVGQALEQPLNYARNYLADMLEPCVRRVIYLDSDLVVVDDISKLWTTSLGERTIGAPEYCHANFTKYFTASFWSNKLFSGTFAGRNPCYFNTDVMVMDLVRWRRFGYTKRIEKWMEIQKISRIYELGSLPPFLLVFAGHVAPIEHRWNQDGLGGDNVEGSCQDLHPGPVSLLHWSGGGKPWFRLDSEQPCPIDALWAPYDLYRHSSVNSERDIALVAALGGTIHLLEHKSAKVIWSFASGPPIYSSHQASLNHDSENENASGPGNHYFVDCGEDWKLYVHSELGEVPLGKSFEEFLLITPHIEHDGGVILGSKKTTVFLLDARTGRLIRTYKLSDYQSASKSNEDSNSLYNKFIEEREKSGSMSLKTDLPLYITRTDYFLQSFAPNSDGVLWNLTVADIDAAFLCKDVENSFTDTSTNAGYELPSEHDVHYRMPSKCPSKPLVFRFRSHSMLESFFHRFKQLKGHQDVMLPMPSPILMFPSQPKIDESLASYEGSDSEVLPVLTKQCKISSVQDMKMLPDSVSRMLSKQFALLSCILFLVIFVGILVYRASAARIQTELTKEPNNLSAKVVSSKRKKIRKSGKNNNNEKKDGGARIKSDKRALLNLNHLTDVGMDGRTIGKLFVSNTEIAKGSNGTIILEGIYGGRPVAVKRLVKAHHDVAFKEIQNLIASDQHPNIIRWYGVEYDQDFVYLSLERCTCSLADLIQMNSDSSDSSTLTMTEYKVRLDSIKTIMQDIKLWKGNGHPSPVLLQLMRDVVSGLVHLHELGIIHRDLKPQNVLIIKERSLRAKLSDMGISKRLASDMSSLGHHATGCGSSGWQAPEQLLHGRQTRAVDLFSLGCVLFFCICGGRHPFGYQLERDINIAKNHVDLFLVEHMPEAVDLFSRLLNPHAEFRPKAVEVLIHPLFWSPERRLSFLRDASDRVELEDRETDSDLLKALESVALLALGGKWDEKMEPAFIANIGRYRRYKFDSVRDLLRVIRNKLNHYRELPKEIQELLGPIPDGFDSYFASRYPKLLIKVYRVVFEYCREEECFQKYFKSSVI